MACRRWLALMLVMAITVFVAPTSAVAGPPRVPAGEVLEVVVPEAVGGKVVVGNLVVDQQNGAGFATGWPCGDTRPLASDLNFPARGATSNLFVGRANAEGRVCFASNVPAHLIFDLTGVMNTVVSFPNRRTDTREGASARRVGAGEELQVTIPEAAGGKTVVGNLAVDGQGGAGFVTAYACGETKPLAADLNFLVGSPSSNRFIGRANDDGRICFVPSVTTHLIVDTNGIVSDVTSFPNRRFDTRTSSSGFFGVPLVVTVPEAVGAKVVVGNLAADTVGTDGFVRSGSCDVAPHLVVPSQSHLNYPAHGAVSNRFVGRADANGRICFFASSPTHLVFDAQAVLGNVSTLSPRRTDTRTRPDAPPCGRIHLSVRGSVPATFERNTRVDVTVTNISPTTCSLGGYPSISVISDQGSEENVPTSHGTFVGEPNPVSSITPGESLTLVVAGNAACAEYQRGVRSPAVQLIVTTSDGTVLSIAEQIDVTCGLNVSRFGTLPTSTSATHQRMVGEDWRILTKETFNNDPEPDLEVAVNTAQYVSMWANARLTGSPPPVDFRNEVVVHVAFDELSCATPILERIIVGSLRVGPLFRILPLPPGWLCPSIASATHVVLTIDRDILPPVPFVMGVDPTACPTPSCDVTVRRL